MHVVTRGRRRDRRPAGPQRASAPTSPARVAFADVEPAAAHAHRRPHRVPRPQRLARRPGRAGPDGPVRRASAPALDPCAALQAPFELRPGEEKEIVFLLGEADDVDEAPAPGPRATASRARRGGARRGAGAAGTRSSAPCRCGRPTRRWTCCSTAGCSTRCSAAASGARSAFYQSGGAYGFRDQLQDVMALVHAAPARRAAHILRAAARQFLEGDVQHWWHPPAGRGVRTRYLRRLPLAAVRRRPLRRRPPATRPSSTSACRSSRRPLLEPEQEDDYGLPDVAERDGAALRALRAGPRARADASAPTACR